MQNMTEGTMDQQMQQCIKNCLECHNVCLQTAAHCLELGGDHARPEHVRLLLDCADICLASANFMSRGSQYHPSTCGICSEICEACAQDCEKMPDDPQMKNCAEVCSRCAGTCQQMARMAA